MVSINELKRGNYVLWEGKPCIVRGFGFSSSDLSVELEEIFSGKVLTMSLPINGQLQEADITRKCAVIISKSKSKMQIMDNSTFETITIDVKEDMLKEAEENDQVTYIKFDNTAKVLEVRKP